MATPANRILVVFIDAAPAAAEANVPALDSVAKRGYSGFLILPEETKPHDALESLLGVNTQAKDSSRSFAYPKMPTAVFSDSPEACAAAKALGITDVQSITSTEPQAGRLESLLHPQDPNAMQLVFIHLTQVPADHCVFQFMDQLLGPEEAASSDQCFVSVVRTAARPHQVDPAVSAHPLRPRQSYERHDGHYAAPGDTPRRRLLVANYHCDRTRCDLVTQFDESEIEARGGHGAMDARIFLKEMAFRLGFAPKYGA